MPLDPQVEQHLMAHGIHYEGLISKTAKIRDDEGNTAEDVLGWDYVVRHDGTCYEFYAPRFGPGMTPPQEVPCLFGAALVGDYNVDFEQAIDIMQQLTCGSTFVAMKLSRPLTHPPADPHWHIKTGIGNQITINAITRDADCGSE